MTAPRLIGCVFRVSMALALASAAAADGHQTYGVSSGRVVVVCPLTVGGRFEVTTSAVTGQVIVDEQKREVEGTLSVDLRTLDAGIGLRTTHLKENYLEVQRGPGFDAATLTGIVLDAPVARLPGGRAGFEGRFTLHGQTRVVNGTVDIARKADQYDVRVRFPLLIDAFQIARPTYLGVGVSNAIDVTVRARFTRADDPARR